MFIILFTHIIKTKQTIKKENIFTLSVQHLEKYQLRHCCFMLASGHPGPEIKILYYCTPYRTVQ